MDLYYGNQTLITETFQKYFNFRADTILVVDMGRFIVTTELSQGLETIEEATQMEMEEQMYSKLLIECSEMQLLFCQNSDSWKDERKEKDTDLHLIPKTSFSATYARRSNSEKTIPRFHYLTIFNFIRFNSDF